MNFSAQRLTRHILIALVAGAIVGLALNLIGAGNEGQLNKLLINGVFGTGGSIFVSLLKMLVVPLVFVSIIGGVTALGDPKALGRIGGKAILLYLGTTAVAITLAMTMALTIGPGEGSKIEVAEATYTAKEAPPLSEVIINMVPTNPIAAMADGKMLQVIIFALLLGIGITLAGDAGKRINQFFADLNEVIMQLVNIVMVAAPIGVFFLIAKTLATLGFAAIGSLGLYFLTVLATLFIHALLVYPILLTVLGRLNPWLFLQKMRSTLVFAFSTSSSNATIPVTLRAVRERLGVDNKVASFTVPLGATINMDGTAIMQGVATVFIANVYGISLGAGDYLAVITTATLASIGTAGVPGVGLIMLALVLEQVGIPVEGIALIIGIDRLLDMVRTAVNVTGDAMVSCVIAKSENAIDLEIFNDPNTSDPSDQKNGANK